MIFVWIEASRSVPSLFRSFVQRTYSQSPRSSWWVTISSFRVSRKRLKTLVCESINILVNMSVILRSSDADKVLPLARNCWRSIRPSLRSPQCFLLQYSIISFISWKIEKDIYFSFVIVSGSVTLLSVVYIWQGNTAILTENFQSFLFLYLNEFSTKNVSSHSLLRSRITGIMGYLRNWKIELLGFPKYSIVCYLLMLYQMKSFKLCVIKGHY